MAEIHVLGSQRFQEKDLVRATGLALGGHGGEDSLKQAADRLAASGMFDAVNYRYVSGPQGTKVEFHVHDTDKLLPAHFDNFVWLAKDELLKRLRAREPLFPGEIPNRGEMFQKLADEMKALLAELGVTANVSVLPEVPQGGSGVVGFLYIVEGVSLPIRSVRFDGASHDMDTVLQSTAGPLLIGSDYTESKITATVKFDFLPQYRKRGYLRAVFGPPAASLLDPATGAVAVALQVQQGAVYRLSALQWTGNTAYPASEFGKIVKAERDRPLDQVQLEDDLGAISKIYGTKGYMEAQLKPGYVLDDPSQTVTVAVSVHEGAQYHMGIVRFDGFGENSKVLLAKLWALRPGDVYDSSYPRAFLMTASRQYDFSKTKIEFSENLNRESKTVDVAWRFSPK